jgi:hypothetical protein
MKKYFSSRLGIELEPHTFHTSILPRGPVEPVDEGESWLVKNLGTNKNVLQRMTDRLADCQSQVGNYYVNGSMGRSRSAHLTF